MTYSELKTNIASFLNRSDLTDKIDLFIDQTEAEINRRVRTEDNVKRATAVLEQQYLTLPSDWQEVINIEIQSNDFGPVLQQSIESLDLHRSSINDAPGQPIFFALVNDTLEFSPKPDTNYTLQLTYYAKITPLSDSDTSNFISNDHPDIYLYGALKHASIFLMEDERAIFFSTQFEKALEEVRLEAEKSKFAKGSLLKRSRTYGKRKKNVYYMNND